MKPSPAALKLAEGILRKQYGPYFSDNDLKEVPEIATIIDESNAELVNVAVTALRVEQCTKDNFPHRSPSWTYDHPDTPIKLAMNNFLSALDKWNKSRTKLANHQPKPE